jgi:hypothetical protein
MQRLINILAATCAFILPVWKQCAANSRVKASNHFFVMRANDANFGDNTKVVPIFLAQ